MIKKLSAEELNNLFDISVVIETTLTGILNTWDNPGDKEALLEDYPWVDEDSAVVISMTDSFNKFFSYSANLLNVFGNMMDTSYSYLTVPITFFFKEDFIIFFKQMLESQASFEENDLFRAHGEFNNILRHLRHFIVHAFDLNDYPEGDAKRVFEGYEAVHGSIEKYVNYLLDYCNNNLIYNGTYAIENKELFNKLLAEADDVSPTEFTAVSEAIMPWDIELLKSGEIAFDSNYIKKLDNRIDNPSSIYNSMPTINEVVDKLPRNLYYKLYVYEDLLDISCIQAVKENKLTFNQILDDFNINSPTSLF